MWGRDAWRSDALRLIKDSMHWSQYRNAIIMFIWLREDPRVLPWYRRLGLHNYTHCLYLLIAVKHLCLLINTIFRFHSQFGNSMWKSSQMSSEWVNIVLVLVSLIQLHYLSSIYLLIKMFQCLYRSLSSLSCLYLELSVHCVKYSEILFMSYQNATPPHILYRNNFAVMTVICELN